MSVAKSRVVVGLSGGIDSTTVVLHLQRAGYEVVGLTLRLHACTVAGGARRSCCGPDAVGTAAKVAAQLGIRHYTRDCAEMFENEVLRRCWRTFARGGTPNPCILCNALVRFPQLVEFAENIGAVGVATGHYARLSLAEGDTPVMRRGLDPAKDQTYFLHQLPPRILKKTLFPLGDVLKKDVREEVRAERLINAERSESQDICIAALDGSYGEALRVRFGEEAVPGIIRDMDGKELGRHSGIHRFTIGQRRKLGVAAGVPVQIYSIDPGSGEIIVSADPMDLETDTCEADGCNWIDGPPEIGSGVLAQVRYRQRAVPAVVEDTGAGGETVRVRFEAPVAASTPGQFLVLYRDDRLLGGGEILK